MLFNSWQFAIYFIVVTAAYFALPYRARWVLLLAASCYFYMAFIPVYILILLFTILIDYGAGILIENTQGKQRRFYLIGSIIANVGVLAIFKYFNFLNGNFAALASAIGWNYPVENLAIILPIGLSFHTFQSLSYTIEVYRGRHKAERHLGLFALYVMFYPQLVAGPIERPQNVLPQFHEQHDFDYDRVTSGLKLMAWGLFKKVVIADRLAVVVNAVYGDPSSHTSFALIMATYFFAYQIYCDFSGYSDIALGAARVMGFRLMENFNQPYLSQSVSEFWRRWHISLSTWFRDYLYIPLGGNRVAKWRWYLNTMIVFMVSGLWHGASWNFVIWGALHGIYIVGAVLIGGLLSRTVSVPRSGPLAWASRAFNTLLTFHLVAFAWIFFRSPTLDGALEMLADIAHVSLAGLNSSSGVLILACVLYLAIYPQLLKLLERSLAASQRLPWQLYPVPLALFVSLIIFASQSGVPGFIYASF